MSDYGSYVLCIRDPIDSLIIHHGMQTEVDGNNVADLETFVRNELKGEKNVLTNIVEAWKLKDKDNVEVLCYEIDIDVPRVNELYKKLTILGISEMPTADFMAKFSSRAALMSKLPRYDQSVVRGKGKDKPLKLASLANISQEYHKKLAAQIRGKLEDIVKKAWAETVEAEIGIGSYEELKSSFRCVEEKKEELGSVSRTSPGFETSTSRTPALTQATGVTGATDGSNPVVFNPQPAKTPTNASLANSSKSLLHVNTNVGRTPEKIVILKEDEEGKIEKAPRSKLERDEWKSTGSIKSLQTTPGQTPSRHSNKRMTRAGHSRKGSDVAFAGSPPKKLDFQDLSTSPKLEINEFTLPDGRSRNSRGTRGSVIRRSSQYSGIIENDFLEEEDPIQNGSPGTDKKGGDNATGRDTNSVFSEVEFRSPSPNKENKMATSPDRWDSYSLNSALQAAAIAVGGSEQLQEAREKKWQPK